MQKRKLNKNLYSLDFILSSTDLDSDIDGIDIPYEDPDNTLTNYCKDKIILFFKKKLYLEAFVLDALLNADVLEHENNEVIFSQFKLRKHLRNIASYASIFASTYNLTEKQVKTAADYVIVESNNIEVLKAKLEKLFKLFRRDEELIGYLEVK